MGTLIEKHEKLFEKNKKLVYKILHSHKIFPNHRLYDDCLQAGLIALYRSIETWDSKRAKLSTHAFWFIRKGIQEELAKTPIVYLGGYESMLRHIDKHYTLSLDYSYGRSQAEDSGTLLDVVSEPEKEDSLFSEDQVNIVHKAVRLCSLTNCQKRAILYFIETGKKEKMNYKGKRIPTAIASAIQKIKHRVKVLRNVYGEPG